MAANPIVLKSRPPCGPSFAGAASTPHCEGLVETPARVTRAFEGREVVKADGERLSYDRLLLATGAEPIRLPIPGAEQNHVHTLRSVADCRAIIKKRPRMPAGPL